MAGTSDGALAAWVARRAGGVKGRNEKSKGKARDKKGKPESKPISDYTRLKEAFL